MNGTNVPCEGSVKAHQPITTTTSPANKDTIQQRERSGTITQKSLNPTLYMNDQDKLHDAIQRFDITEETDNNQKATMTRRPVSEDEEDSEEEEDSDYDTAGHYTLNSNRSTITSISSLLSNDTNYDMLLARLGSPLSSGIGTHSSSGSGGMQDTTTTTSVINASSFYNPTSTSSTLSSSPPSSSSSSSCTTQEHDIDWGKKQKLGSMTVYAQLVSLL